MDVRINELTSNVHTSDARALLTPEVLQQIVDAVLVRLQEEAQRERERGEDASYETNGARS